MKSKLRALSAVFLLVAVQLGSGPAAADLEEDSVKLERAWERSGEAVILEPRVLTHGMLLPLPLPIEATTPREGCTTVAVLSALSTGFVLRFLPSEDAEARNEAPEPSVGGAAQIVRCGADRKRLSRLAIEMRSPRGILRTVVGRSDRPLPSLRRILLHRDAGDVASTTRPGPRPSPGPLAERVERLEARYRRMGAQNFRQRLVPAGEAGAQRILLDFEPGCHRVNVLGVSPAAAHGLDLDAELRWVDTGLVAAVDRTDSADTTLSTCTGSARAAMLTFAGALPSIPVVVAHASWRLPAGLRESWGAHPRAHIAQAIWENRAQPIETSPIYESLGVNGSTLLPVELELDACYLAAVGAMRDAPGRLSLAVSHGAEQAVSHGTGTDAAAVTAFCANGDTSASVEVEARGSGVAWLLAIWQTGRVTLGEDTL